MPAPRGDRARILSFVWGPFGFRADELAAAVGAERVSITVHYGPRYLAPLRYVALFFKTLILLRQRKPRVVYAQNPPIFCPLTSLIYCRLSGAKLVVDHHSIWRVKTLGAGPISSAIGFLEGFVSRSASGNTAPHKFWGERLEAMGARNVLVVHDYVEKNSNSRDEALRRNFSDRAVISLCAHGGHPLERIEAEASAFAQVQSAALLITGPREKLDRRISEIRLPENVRYLGFLPRQTYESLKASVDLAVNITDEPFTLSHVLLEYAASSLPMISSRQEVLEGFFGDALLYTETSGPSEIAAKVRMMLDTGVRDEYRTRVITWYSRLSDSHEREVRELRSMLAG